MENIKTYISKEHFTFGMKKIASQFIILLVVTVFISSCRGIDGEGDTVVKDKSISEKFTGISLSLNGDVYVTQGSEPKIIVHGQQNIIDVLKLEVNDNVLHVGFRKNNVHNYDKLKFYITTAALQILDVNGSGKIIAEDSISTGTIDINISGSGDIKLKKLAATGKVKANISGSGNIELAGHTPNTWFTISGSGNIYAFELPCKNSECTISGSGNIETTVTDKLDADISGSGDIRYKGRPVINSKTSGSGKITHVD